MASKIGMNLRNEAAQQRIDAAVEGLGASLEVAIAPIPQHIRDRKYRETLRLEWTADALEQLVGVFSGNVQDVRTFSLETAEREQLARFAAAIGVEDAGEAEVYPETGDLVTAIEKELPINLLSLTEAVLELVTGEAIDNQAEADGAAVEDGSDAADGDEVDEPAEHGDETEQESKASVPEPLNLKGKKRPELNRIAAELGVEAPEQLPNIPAVIAAIETKRAEGTLT